MTLLPAPIQNGSPVGEGLLMLIKAIRLILQLRLPSQMILVCGKLRPVALSSLHRNSCFSVHTVFSHGRNPLAFSLCDHSIASYFSCPSRLLIVLIKLFPLYGN